MPDEDERWTSPFKIEIGGKVVYDPDDDKKPTTDAERIQNFLRKKRHATDIQGPGNHGQHEKAVRRKER